MTPRYEAGRFDVAVIGAGHAGIEAALASARLGAKTVVFSISLDAVGNMPCNPSIGGIAKGCLVREIDALGGEMARAADATCIQFRLLGRGRGPAVRSPRAQADRTAYRSYMKRALEREPNLSVKQAEVVSIETEDGRVSAVVTALGAVYRVKCVVCATGTFLGGKIFVGEYSRESGPDGMFPASELTKSLVSLGLAAACPRLERGRRSDGGAGGRTRPFAVQLLHARPPREPGDLLPHIYKRADARRHTLSSRPLAALRR